MTPGTNPRRLPVPLPGGLTLAEMDALYGRLDILRNEISEYLEEGYLPRLESALSVELARLYEAMTRVECSPGHHRPGCSFSFGNLDGYLDEYVVSGDR